MKKKLFENLSDTDSILLSVYEHEPFLYSILSFASQKNLSIFDVLANRIFARLKVLYYRIMWNLDNRVKSDFYQNLRLTDYQNSDLSSIIIVFDNYLFESISKCFICTISQLDHK